MILDRNRVYNMNCLDGIRQMIAQDMRVDCVITDPPYLIDYKTHRRQDKQHKFCKAIQGDTDPQLIIDLVPLLFDVMKDNTPLYMFCGSDKVDFFKQQVERYFTIKNLIIWDKGNHTAGDLDAQYGKRYEIIIYANKGRAPFNPEMPRYDDNAVEPLEDFTNPLNRWHRTNIVKKSDMEIYDKHFCESYTAALAYKKEMLENCIAGNEKRIAEMTAKNEKYRATIEATSAELQQLNDGGAL